MSDLSTWLSGISADYGVNPVVFGVLYFGAMPVFLGVAAWLAKRARMGRPVLLQAGLLLFLAIQPYLYVALFGENLPRWVYGAIVVLVALAVWSTVRTIRKKKTAPRART
jgi:hypothetical protein